MKIYLLRHGIAHDREAADCPADPDRALTTKGRERTRSAAQGFAILAPEIDQCFSSPYLRAVQTLAIAREVLDLEHLVAQKTETLCPEAPPASILDLLRLERPESVLLCGHAPHLDRLIGLLLTGRDTECTWLKKASVALLGIDPSLQKGEALLHWLLPPKALRSLAGDASTRKPANA